jgi:selenocysteine lyase/cysteine desulfurase
MEDSMAPEPVGKWSRRAFLRSTGAGAAFAFSSPSLAELAAATKAIQNQAPEQAAANQSYWGQVQNQFDLDRTMINLNTGHHCSHPRVVAQAVDHYLRMENMLPVRYGSQIGANLETVRRGLADEFGCDPEEMAITRNASESLQILQSGLDLKAGDEVITTEHDYPRMLTTWDQRLRRDKLKITRLQFPVPTTADDLYERFERAITPQTKVLHFCHITNLTGQLFPVQRICRLARSRGIFTIVDGAHAGAHFPYKLRDLECDSYGVSLHKWLLAPFGTGLLFVRKELIPKVWPLQAAPAVNDANIRKFEEIGTAPMATKAAIADALAFHRTIGAERKAQRLYYLTMRWAEPLKKLPRIQMHSSLKPGETWGMATVGIQGMTAGQITSALFDRHRIVVAGLAQGAYPGQQFPFQGIRVTPNVYTTVEEVDTFARAMETLAKS